MTLLESKKQIEGSRKFPKKTKHSTADSLHHLKKRYELQNDQAKTYAEVCREEIEANQENIRNLRIEISEARKCLRSAKTNECLMRQALRDHHPGSSIFREWEPRDVNESVDYRLSAMQSKLNKLKHAHTMKLKHLNSLLLTFNEAVNDSAYLDLEGPMGDTRCLAIENEICVNDKKLLEAEMIGHTYRRIRDQLAMEGLSSQSALDAASKLQQSHEKELYMCQKSEKDAAKGKEIADADVYKSEFDLYNLRRGRKIEVADFKKKTEEEKHDFTALWKTIQAHFAAQESMPLSHMTYHSKLSISASADLTDGTSIFEYNEEELELMKNVTGSHTVPEVADKYEKQEGTYQYAKSLVNELEVRKCALLQRLGELTTERNSLLLRAETRQEAQLRSAAGDARAADPTRWSRLAACNRATQALTRLRQLLEYLTAVFVSAGLIEAPPASDPADTEAHLHGLMASASAGAAALMASLRGAEPERTQRAAAAAAFLVTRSERRVSRRRAQLEDDTVRDDIGYVGTDGETTGDDAVPSRAAIKRQAHMIVMARQKSGSRSKKK